MEGDYIVRESEVAGKLYFIKNGKVKVLATDNMTALAILNEGCYFSEIGCLLKDKRSVSVKVVTNCILSTLSKKELRQILVNHPE